MAGQVSQGKSITEALKQYDPELLDIFTKFLAEYVREDASLEMRLEKLLLEVSAVGDRNLCVQAEVTPDLLGVVADSINYLVNELAKVVILTQKTSAEEIAASNKMLSVVQEEIKVIESMAKVVLTSDPTTRENIRTPLLNMHKSVNRLREDIERIRNLSNQLYTSVSSFQLPPEEAIYWG